MGVQLPRSNRPTDMPGCRNMRPFPTDRSNQVPGFVPPQTLARIGQDSLACFQASESRRNYTVMAAILLFPPPGTVRLLGPHSPDRFFPSSHYLVFALGSFTGLNDPQVLLGFSGHPVALRRVQPLALVFYYGPQTPVLFVFC